MHKIDPNHPLVVAARQNNDEAEGGGLKGLCERYGVAIQDLHYLSEQRAFRALLVFEGRYEEAMTPRETTLMLSPNERDIVDKALTPAYMDGIMIGWRAASDLYAQKPDPYIDGGKR